MLFCSAGGLSLRDASLGKSRACAKGSFNPSNVDSRRKAWQLTKVRNKKKVIDAARNKGRKVGIVQSFTKWLAIDTNEKLQERTQNHLAVQVPSLSAPDHFRKMFDKSWMVSYGSSLRNKGGVSNLPSLPWNIAGKVHKIRTTSKRRSNLPACFGKPLPPRCGKIPASSKSSSGGSGSSSPTHVNTPENKVHLHKERDSSRGQNLDYNYWMPDVQKTFH